MSANLYPGVKALHLVLTTPYDLIRTDDIRDDLTGIKVWYSKVQGFDPAAAQGTLSFNTASLSVIIPNLDVNTTYYVRYAFVSALDENTYTISSELSAKVYDENTSVYGYLTNDPTGIATNSDGSGGDFSLATGTFKVYSLSQDITGSGPVYSIKPNTNYYILGPSINPTTGVYSCTGIAQDSGSITFLATYNNIVVEQVWNVYKGIAGASAPLIQLSATNTDFVFKDQFATSPITSQTELKATLKNLTGTVVYTAKAFTREGTELGNVSFTQTGNNIVITGTQFAALGTTVGTVIVTATLGVVSDSFTLYRINDGTEQITVELSNSAHPIPAANNGDTVPANYVGSGTTIKVKQGNTYLPVDPSSPYDSLGTWNIFNITSVGITADPTPTIGSNYIDFDTHAAMTADSAYIDYTITYRTTTGQIGTQVVRQSFAKSKEGVVGANAPAVNLVAPRLAFVTPKNNGTTSPDSITLTADTNNILAPQYVWKINDVIQTGQSNNTLVVPKFTDVGSKTFKVEVSGSNNQAEPISLYDIITLYHINEGSDSLVVALDNESQTISCDSTGTPIAGQFPITRNTIVVRGTDVLSAGVSYAKVEESGITSSISAAGVITITGITQLFGSATYSFTVGSVTLYKTLTLNKSIDGSSAPVVSLTAPTQVFITLKNGGGYAQNSITITATAINIPGAQYQWYVDNVLQSGQSGSTFVVSAFPSGTSKAIKAVVTGTGGKTAYDIISVFSLQEGSDSLAAGLSNENQTITADPNGNIYGGQLPITSQMTVVRGSEILTSGVTYSKVSESGLVASISSTGAITVSSYSAASIGTVTFRATVGTATLDKVLTVTKTKDGIPGTPGISVKGDDGDPGAIGITSRIVYQLVSQLSSAPAYTSSTSGGTSLPGASWSDTAPTATVGNVVWYSYGRYNPNTYAYQGIPANTTLWSAPIAASVFQDIRSDNWGWSNGTLQTGAPNLSDWINYTYGTGYYFKKDDGTLWATSTYLKGNVLAQGVTTALQISTSIAGSLNYVYPAMAAFASTDLPSSIAGNVRAGLVAVAQSATNSSWNVGLLGSASGVTGANFYEGNIGGRKGVGVFGSGDAVGGVFEAKIGTAVGLLGRNLLGGTGLQVDGISRLNGNLIVTGGDITATGNITAYTSSDKRLKENIVIISSALDKLHMISGYTYDWKDEVISARGGEDGYFVRKHDIGIIAQEILEVIPQAVATKQDGTLAVDYPKIIPLLIEAIKELDRRTR